MPSDFDRIDSIGGKANGTLDNYKRLEQEFRRSELKIGGRD